jgi:hypothetical protein
LAKDGVRPLDDVTDAELASIARRYFFKLESTAEPAPFPLPSDWRGKRRPKRTRLMLVRPLVMPDCKPWRSTLVMMRG